MRGGQKLVAALITVVAMDAAAWTPRQPPIEPPKAHELRQLDRWPDEPTSPAPVDAVRFGEAVAALCGRDVPSDELLLAAREADVDAFALAGLMFAQSRCHDRPRVGYGLLAIQPEMYLRGGGPPLPVDRRALWPAALRDPVRGLRTGARLLRMWQELHPRIDRRFASESHRSEIAHFIWGDRVRGSGNEDLVFTARRRLIEHYAGLSPVPWLTTLGIPFVSPLDGSPRVATSGPGEDREGGLRRHRGLDIAALEGEPVRSVADGVVIFAGVSLAGSVRHGPVAPDQLGRYRKRPLGVGGIYLCVRHEAPGKDVVSCYMHLDSYFVAEGTRVLAGELIGYVGRTGVKNSPAHLHIEVRVDDLAHNPLRYLAGWVIPPQATKTYRHMLAARRARLLTNTR